MLDYLKSLKWIDYYYLSLVDPRRLFNLISRDGNIPYITGFITIAFVSIAEIVSMSLPGTASQFFYSRVTYGWILSVFLIVLRVFLFVALVDLFAQLRGYKASVKQLIPLVTISFFPRVLLLPLMLIISILNFAPWFFYIFFSIGFLVWQGLIIIQGISEANQTSFGESLVILIMPFLFSAVILFFVGILTIITVIDYFTV